MNLQKWFGIVLGLGLILALTPINASAWPNQSYQGFTRHQPGGRAYGRYGQRPPMFQHNRPFARARHPFQQQRYGQFQGSQNFGQPWMGQAQNYGAPYASPGFQGYPYPQPYPSGQFQGNQNFGLLPWLLGQAPNYGQNYGAPYAQGCPSPQPYPYGQFQGNQQNFGQPWMGQGQNYGQNYRAPHGPANPQGNSQPGHGLHLSNL